MKNIEIQDEVLNNLTKRRDGESPNAYAAFGHFARMEAKDRVMDKALPIISKKTNLTVWTLREYVTDHKWNERASLIDAYLLKLDILERQKQNAELNLAFIETNRKLKVSMMENLEKGMNLLTAILSDESVQEMKFKVTDVGSLVKALKEGVALVNEIPTEVINNRPLAVKDFNSIESLDELDALEAEIDAELAKTSQPVQNLKSIS